MTATDQQQAIVNAALALLASGGPQALRVRDIAEAAGCTTMTVYSRFGGKDGIIEAIYVDGFTRFTEALNEQAHAPAAERSTNLAAAYRTWALANPGSYQVMFTEAVPGFTPSDEATMIALGSFQVLIDSVLAMQRDGQVHAGDATEIAWSLWGLTHGLVMLELADMSPTPGEPDFEAIYATAVVSMMRGFAP